jgi:hypothetical protein
VITPDSSPDRFKDFWKMVISTPAEGDDGSRLELLLGDIRDVFAEKMDLEITSADLVKALVAIKGRPWADLGKSRRPLTQNGLARMLKPLGIGPDKIGPETKRLSGYRRHRFRDAFARFLPPGIRTERDEMGTGSAEPGLSSHRIRQHADWYEDRAYWHYSKSALDAGVLDAELRAILRKEVLPEHVEIEFERVTKVVFASR